VEAAPRVLTEPPPAADERVPYGRHPLQFADRYGDDPQVAFLHGGFWKPDYDLAHAGHACAALAAAGIATWSVEYRRGEGWRATLDDVRRGVAGARVVAGHSAGGHLALWTGLSAVALAPVADLDEARRLGLGDGAVERFLGAEKAAYADAAPRAAPHQVLVHGTADDVVPFALSDRYAATTGARLVPLVGAGHFEPISPWSAEWPTVVAEIRQLLRDVRPQ
jgi:predicted alpha/beta hydrolase family esterase